MQLASAYLESLATFLGLLCNHLALFKGPITQGNRIAKALNWQII